MATVQGRDTEEGGGRNRRKLDLYNDLWIKDMRIKEWMEKHFKYTNDIMTSENNTAYANIRCQAAGNEVRKRLGNKGKYEAGEVLICRLKRNKREGQSNVNIGWKVLDVRGDEITIQDIKNERDVRVVDEKVVDGHFR